jgi:hypothetical protein
MMNRHMTSLWGTARCVVQLMVCYTTSYMEEKLCVVLCVRMMVGHMTNHWDATC